MFCTLEEAWGLSPKKVNTKVITKQPKNIIENFNNCDCEELIKKISKCKECREKILKHLGISKFSINFDNFIKKHKTVIVIVISVIIGILLIDILKNL